MNIENCKNIIYPNFDEEKSDIVSDCQIPLMFKNMKREDGRLRVLSLFSGCGGMDLGFEGGFIANAKSFPPKGKYVSEQLDKDWVLLRKKPLLIRILPPVAEDKHLLLQKKNSFRTYYSGIVFLR